MAKSARELDEIARKALIKFNSEERDQIEDYFDKISSYAEYAASQGERSYTYYFDEDEIENAALMAKAILQKFKDHGFRGDVLHTILVLFWK